MTALAPLALAATPTITPTVAGVEAPPSDGAILTPPPPANDNFSEGLPITGYNGTVLGTTLGASVEEGEQGIPIGDGGPGHTVWYQWTAPGTGAVTFDLCIESGFNSKLGAWTGTRVWDLDLLAYNDDSCGSASIMAFGAEAGATYAIQVDGFDGDAGIFYLNWGMAEPLPYLFVANASANEGDAATSAFAFTVSMSAVSEQDVSVDWETGDGTATSPDDYAESSGVAIITAGDLSTTFNVAVLGDLVKEPNETFTVTMSEPEGATIEDGHAVGTILNDDLAADLTVDVSNFGGPTAVGHYMSYYVEVFNPAGGDPSAAVISDTVPANTTVVYAATRFGTCVLGDTVVCDLGIVAGGTSVDAVIYVIPNRTGVFKNTVSVAGSLPDSNPKNNAASVKKTVIPNKAGCTMIGTNDVDVIHGTQQDDVICTYGGADTVYGGMGNDVVYAGSGQDTVTGGPGSDILYGQAGDDIIIGGADPDVIDGGTGYDTVSYAFDPSGVSVNLQAGTATDGYPHLDGTPPGDTLLSLNTVIGSDYADMLVGSNDFDHLFGGLADDTLMGSNHHDTLDGGGGSDHLDGGKGLDDCTTGEFYQRCES